MFDKVSETEDDLLFAVRHVCLVGSDALCVSPIALTHGLRKAPGDIEMTKIFHDASL